MTSNAFMHFSVKMLSSMRMRVCVCVCVCVCERERERERENMVKNYHKSLCGTWKSTYLIEMNP